MKSMISGVFVKHVIKLLSNICPPRPHSFGYAESFRMIKTQLNEMQIIFRSEFRLEFRFSLCSDERADDQGRSASRDCSRVSEFPVSMDHGAGGGGEPHRIPRLGGHEAKSDGRGVKVSGVGGTGVAEIWPGLGVHDHETDVFRLINSGFRKELLKDISQVNDRECVKRKGRGRC